MGDRAVEVAVNDPLLTLQFLLQRNIKFLPGQMLPIAAPVQPVQMDKWKSGLFGKLCCKGGLAAAGITNNQNSFRCDPSCLLIIVPNNGA